MATALSCVTTQESSEREMSRHVRGASRRNDNTGGKPLLWRADTQPKRDAVLLKLWAMVAHTARAAGSLLTTTSEMPVMPVFMVMVPNPSGRNGWRMDCDRGIDYVWPFNFGAWLAVVMAYAIVPHLPRKKKKPAEQQQ